MEILKYFDSKIKDIMYDVVGLLFPGVFCLLITMGILSIEKIQSILACVGITYKFSSISGFNGTAIFLIFAYFYGVLLRGIYESFFVRWIEPYTLEDYNSVKIYIKDSSIEEKKEKLTSDEQKKVQSVYKKVQNRIKKENLEENKTIIEYLNKYIEKRNMYRIIYIQMIIISFIILFTCEIISLENIIWKYIIPCIALIICIFPFKNIIWKFITLFISFIAFIICIYLFEKNIDVKNIVAFIILMGLNIACIKVFENYIKLYFKRINNQILMGNQRVYKKGE